MLLSLKLLSVSALLVCLVTACSNPKALHPSARAVPSQSEPKPSPPKRGEPINIMALVKYFAVESTNLLQQGRVATNLLQQLGRHSCRLNLAPPPARALAPGELAESVEMGVAVIGRIAKVNGRPELTPTATGFFLTDSGALATCGHVVNWDKLIGLTVMTRDGRVCPVREILAMSTNWDLAILQVEGQGFTPLPVAPKTRQGAPVWVLGHPFPWYYMLTEGIASGYYVINEQMQVPILTITADFASGSSGGPVLNENGAVVGVAVARQTLGLPGAPQMPIRFCVPSSGLLNMIEPGPGP
jgi:serine protease Do